MSAGPYSIGSDHWPGISKLIEEMGELHQVLGKLMATHGDELHWDGSNLRVRMIEEMGDVLAAIHFVANENFTAMDHIKMTSRYDEKLARFEEWHAEQRP